MKTLPEKLLVKPGASLALVDAPDGHAALYADRPHVTDVAKASAVVLYAVHAADVARRVPALAKNLAADARLWVCYPKAGKLDTDLNRDLLHAQLASLGFDGVRLVSVDATWSAMMFKT